MSIAAQPPQWEVHRGNRLPRVRGECTGNPQLQQRLSEKHALEVPPPPALVSPAKDGALRLLAAAPPRQPMNWVPFFADGQSRGYPGTATPRPLPGLRTSATTRIVCGARSLTKHLVYLRGRQVSTGRMCDGQACQRGRRGCNRACNLQMPTTLTLTPSPSPTLSLRLSSPSPSASSPSSK